MAVDSAVNSMLPDAAPEYSANPLQAWANIGVLIWIAGIAAMLVYGAVSYIILNRKMHGAVHVIANVYESEKTKSPFVLGTIRPKIYDVNEYGLTNGSALMSQYLGYQPDLVLAQGVDGAIGYMYNIDTQGFEPMNPEEALKWQRENAGKNWTIPLYESDGRTVIGEFQMYGPDPD